jgi:phage gp46-like protein
MDVYLFNTPNGGDIEYRNGLAVMSDGLKSACFLSLFGGNEEDSGDEGDDAKQWWGNLIEQDEARQYRSRTQYLLRTLPAIPANRGQLEDAARDDLAWMLEEFATSVDAEVSLVAPRRVEIEINIEIGESKYTFTFPETWGQ